MKNIATKVYTSVFVIVLLVGLYVPSYKINLVVQLGALFIYLVFEKPSVSKGFLQQFTPFLYIVIVGFIGTFIHHYHKMDIVKDIIYLFKPMISLLLAYLLYKKINDFKVFSKTIVIAGVCSALIHFLIIKFLVDPYSGSINATREFTKDNFLEVFAIFFLIYYKKFKGEPLFSNPYFKWAALLLIGVSSLLYFSRTMIVLAAILAVSLQGYTMITKKTMGFIGAGVLAIGLLYVYLYSTNVRRNADGVEAFLYKIKIAPEEVFQTQVSLANKKALWDHWRGYEASRAMYLMEQNSSSYVFGTGIGSMVNLKFFAPISDDIKGIKYISELHNGYAFIFYKTGLIGLLIYFFILYRWYMYVYKKRTFVTLLISSIGVIYLFTTLTITGIYNKRDIIILILGALFAFYEQEQKTKNIAPEESVQA